MNRWLRVCCKKTLEDNEVMFKLPRLHICFRKVLRIVNVGERADGKQEAQEAQEQKAKSSITWPEKTS